MNIPLLLSFSAIFLFLTHFSSPVLHAQNHLCAFFNLKHFNQRCSHLNSSPRVYSFWSNSHQAASSRRMNPSLMFAESVCGLLGAYLSCFWTCFQVMHCLSTNLIWFLGWEADQHNYQFLDKIRINLVTSATCKVHFLYDLSSLSRKIFAILEEKKNNFSSFLFSILAPVAKDIKKRKTKK